MAIIGLKEVKDLGRLTTAEHDALLTLLIEAVQERAEEYCGRVFDYGTYTEHFDTVAEQGQVRVKAYPIETITSVTDDALVSARAVSVSADVMSAEEYLHWGVVQLWNTEEFFSEGRGAVTVVYTGGYTPESAPASLKLALAQWVLFEFNHAERVGVSQQSADGASISYAQSGDMPLEVQAKLSHFKAWERTFG